MCISALKEIISHYTKRASNVYMCSLDATKAFDEVNFVKIFQVVIAEEHSKHCVATHIRPVR